MTEADRKQIEIYKQMTPGQKWQVARDLYWSARRWKAAWLRQIHPDWTEEQVQNEVREIFLYARS